MKCKFLVEFELRDGMTSDWVLEQLQDELMSLRLANQMGVKPETVSVIPYSLLDAKESDAFLYPPS